MPLPNHWWGSSCYNTSRSLQEQPNCIQLHSMSRRELLKNTEIIFKKEAEGEIAVSRDLLNHKWRRKAGRSRLLIFFPMQEQGTLKYLGSGSSKQPRGGYFSGNILLNCETEYWRHKKLVWPPVEVVCICWREIHWKLPNTKISNQKVSELKTVEGLERTRGKCDMCLPCFFSSVGICLWPLLEIGFGATWTLPHLLSLLSYPPYFQNN